MKSKLALVLSLLCAAGFARAQEPPPFLQAGLDYLRKMTAPKKDLDPAFVLQPELKWEAVLEGTGIRTGADLHNDITVTEISGFNSTVYTGTLETGMQKRLYKKIGAGISYGGLGASYGVELGRTKGEKNTYFSLGSIGSFYGARIQYYKTHEYVEGTLDFNNSAPITLLSDHPCQARDLTMDAFYAFNKKHFAYSAAYVGRLAQRRSVGSWMVAAKFLQGDFSFNPEDQLLIALLNGLNRYSTLQALIGGGYSYNWVILHRDPEEPATWKGLRNLTLNATILPMLSLFNYISTEQGDGSDRTRVRFVGQPAFSPTIRCAIGYAWDSWHVNVLASYNRFGFRGADTEVKENGGNLHSNVQTQGVFYDLTAQVKVGMKF